MRHADALLRIEALEAQVDNALAIAWHQQGALEEAKVLIAQAWDEGRANGIRYMLTKDEDGYLRACRFAYDHPNPYRETS